VVVITVSFDFSIDTVFGRHPGETDVLGLGPSVGYTRCPVSNENRRNNEGNQKDGCE
jgi:hypothetical protein